jgi:DnaJ-class molecular chaperone
MLANVVHTVAYFCADCAGKGKIQNEPLQLCNEENAANERERHGTVKVRLYNITHQTSQRVMPLSCI